MMRIPKNKRLLIGVAVITAGALVYTNSQGYLRKKLVAAQVALKAEKSDGINAADRARRQELWIEINHLKNRLGMA